MFRQPRELFVSSTRVRKPMAQDISREAKKRRTQVAEEIRRRLEFYASHKHLLEAPAADQQPTTA